MHLVNPEKEQKIFITGPVGQLEAMVSGITNDEVKPNIGVICHPHPLYQGTMNNKVVTTVIRTWQQLGLATIRFNFRGVGDSEGHYGNGSGEVLDLKAVLAFVWQIKPDAKIWLAGFSFGALITLKAAAHGRVISGLISIAPALPFFDFLKLERPQCPWLVIHGEKDELISLQEVKAWYQLLNEQKKDAFYWEFILLPEASHFFHGHLVELKTAVEQFMNRFLVFRG